MTKVIFTYRHQPSVLYFVYITPIARLYKVLGVWVVLFRWACVAFAFDLGNNVWLWWNTRLLQGLGYILVCQFFNIRVSLPPFAHILTILCFGLGWQHGKCLTTSRVRVGVCLHFNRAVRIATWVNQRVHLCLAALNSFPPTVAVT